MNEISFNAVALKELKMLAMMRRVADPATAEGAMWGRMRMHIVQNEIMVGLGASSKLNAEWDFLTMLRDEGRKAAQAFLDKDGDGIGKRSTADIDSLMDGV